MLCILYLGQNQARCLWTFSFAPSQPGLYYQSASGKACWSRFCSQWIWSSTGQGNGFICCTCCVDRPKLHLWFCLLTRTDFFWKGLPSGCSYPVRRSFDSPFQKVVHLSCSPNSWLGFSVFDPSHWSTYLWHRACARTLFPWLPGVLNEISSIFHSIWRLTCRSHWDIRLNLWLWRPYPCRKWVYLLQFLCSVAWWVMSTLLLPCWWRLGVNKDPLCRISRQQTTSEGELGARSCQQLE